MLSATQEFHLEQLFRNYRDLNDSASMPDWAYNRGELDTYLWQRDSVFLVQI